MVHCGSLSWLVSPRDIIPSLMVKPYPLAFGRWLQRLACLLGGKMLTKVHSPPLSVFDKVSRMEIYDFIQVWSLSSFKVSCRLLTNDLNQVSSVSLLMTSSTALANEGLFELTRRPSLTRAVSSSFAETTEEPSCSQVKRPKSLILVIFKQMGW